MQTINLVMPQLGEGLQEAQIVRLLKRPGEAIQRDEPVYEVATDKAEMAIEAPQASILYAWLVNEGDTVTVGAPIGQIVPAETILPAHSLAQPTILPILPAPLFERSQPTTAATLLIPPRSRTYCREHGIEEAEMLQIPAANGYKLLPTDVDDYLAKKQRADQPLAYATPHYQELTLTAQQRLLSAHLKRSLQTVVPASLTIHLDWPQLQAAKERLRQRFPQIAASEFETVAYALAQASRSYPQFRSVLEGNDHIRQYAHLNLGIAVQRSNDDLVTAVIANADRLEFSEFVLVAHRQITQALDGKDQASAATQLLLTYMADYGVIAATPILVAPAIAIIFIGAPYAQGEGQQVANLTLTVDHRLINGVAGANFAQEIVKQIAALAGATNKPPLAPADGSLPTSPLRHESTQAAERDDTQPSYAHLLARVTAHVAQVLAEPAPFAANIASQLETPLLDMGLNSRLSLVLTQALAAEFKIPLAATLVWNYPTIQAIALHIAEKLAVLVAPPAVAHPLLPEEASRNPQHDTVTSERLRLAALSEEDATLLLEQKLANLRNG